MTAAAKKLTTQMEKMIQKVRKQPGLELEFRLGKFGDAGFEPGISQEFFNDVVADLDTFDDMRTLNQLWEEEMDVYYELNGIAYRSRVSYPNEDMHITTKTITKTKLQNIDVQTNSPYDFRIALASECPVDNATLPCVVMPSLVRLKHVKRYELCKNDCKPTWLFDISKSWTGKSRTAAEESQHSNMPTFNVECELIDTEQYLRAKTNNYMAESMLQKARGLIGYPNAECTIRRSV
jgi:hypothetical protein